MFLFTWIKSNLMNLNHLLSISSIIFKFFNFQQIMIKNISMLLDGSEFSRFIWNIYVCLIFNISILREIFLNTTSILIWWNNLNLRFGSNDNGISDISIRWKLDLSMVYSIRSNRTGRIDQICSIILFFCIEGENTSCMGNSIRWSMIAVLFVMFIFRMNCQSMIVRYSFPMLLNLPSIECFIGIHRNSNVSFR